MFQASALTLVVLQATIYPKRSMWLEISIVEVPVVQLALRHTKRLLLMPNR
jgi:hypothetical protein